jgi:CubicO group peptidase (beta-lactamase class C family)
LPDYLQDKQENGSIVIKELEAGIDQAWPVEKVIEAVKRMKPHFPPGTPGKAKYIDTNHQILELVIENVMGEPVEKALNNLFQELAMSHTYVCADVNDTGYVPIRYKGEERNLSRFLTSTRNDIISSAHDQMTFIKTFFNGHFYPKDRLYELEKWNRVFFPFAYGIGIQRFSLPKAMTLMTRIPDMIGHGGSTGAVAFYSREKELYFAGTINQQAKPSAIYNLIIKVSRKASAA